MLQAAISTATSGDQPIVTGKAGYKVRVVSYLIVSAGAVVVTWKSSGGTALSGPMTMATGQPIGSAYAEQRIAGGYDGHFDTMAGENLVLNLGGNIQVSGHINYLLIPSSQ